MAIFFLSRDILLVLTDFVFGGRRIRMGEPKQWTKKPLKASNQPKNPTTGQRRKGLVIFVSLPCAYADDYSWLLVHGLCIKATACLPFSIPFSFLFFSFATTWLSRLVITRLKVKIRGSMFPKMCRSMFLSPWQVGVMLGIDCGILWNLFPLRIYRQMLWVIHL